MVVDIKKKLEINTAKIILGAKLLILTAAK